MNKYWKASWNASKVFQGQGNKVRCLLWIIYQEYLILKTFKEHLKTIYLIKPLPLDNNVKWYEKRRSTRKNQSAKIS